MKIGLTLKNGEEVINFYVSYVERPLNRLLVYGDNTEFCSEGKAAVNVEGLLGTQIRKIDGCLNPVPVVSQHQHHHHHYRHQIQRSCL